MSEPTAAAESAGEDDPIRRKSILITNDDGVFSEGIKLLARALSGVARVTVVAPDREQSASGHALTLHRPLRIQQIEDGWYSVDGTPTDCVNLALLWLLRDDPPDLVCSGINFGTNLGDDVTYSGTVSATFEGTLLGVPSVAFSQEVGEHFSFEPGARYAAELAAELLRQETLPEDLLLNVNFPAGTIRGVRFTHLGRRRYQQSIIEKQDPRGRKYYWIAGSPRWEEAEGTDFDVLSKGCVTITPLHLDLTDYRGLETYGTLREALETASGCGADETGGARSGPDPERTGS
ncbi:MAG: 5'/3'-nucleotidase SurE [Acidobacteriota bacterium]